MRRSKIPKRALAQSCCECNVAENLRLGQTRSVSDSTGPSSALSVLLGRLAPAFAACLICVATLTGAPQQHDNVKPKVPPIPSKELSVPFSAGETLKYQVSWSAFSDAASLQLSVPERRDLFGSQTWHFRGEAHTLSPVRTLFAIDDQFDSYSDAGTLDSRQFETHLNEMGKQSNQVQRIVASGNPSHLPPPVVVVPPDTRDALGILYALRCVDWRQTSEFHAPVFDGKDIFDVRASREATDDAVKVAAGSYAAARIAIHVFQYQREVSNVRYVMWVASDASRTPVAMEADLPFGTIRAELTSATH